tara:strand:+ start:2648 stop:3166 length:519 start_codon:yes stop_codon:yes gene_type:complete
MPNPIIRSRTTGSLAAALVVTCALTAPALADEVRPELDTPSQIAALVLALADTHRQPLHIFGLTAERTSQAEAVLQGRSFEADCRTLSLTAVDLLRRAGYKARTVSVQLPPTASCARLYINGEIVCSRGHMIAAYRDGDREMAIDGRQTKPVPLTELLQNSRYTVNVGKGGR